MRDEQTPQDVGGETNLLTKFLKQRAASLTLRLWRGKCDAPVEQIVCDFSSFKNS